MGHEAPCELLATKTVVAGASGPLYSHCAIIDSPTHLPDGDYEVEFGGEVAITRKQSGVWTVGAVLPHTYQEVAKFYASQGETKSGSTTREHTKGTKDFPSTGKLL